MKSRRPMAHTTAHRRSYAGRSRCAIGFLPSVPQVDAPFEYPTRFVPERLQEITVHHFLVAACRLSRMRMPLKSIETSSSGHRGCLERSVIGASNGAHLFVVTFRSMVASMSTHDTSASHALGMPSSAFIVSTRRPDRRAGRRESSRGRGARAAQILVGNRAFVVGV